VKPRELELYEVVGELRDFLSRLEGRHGSMEELDYLSARAQLVGVLAVYEMRVALAEIGLRRGLE
jgi:hypothetical protein